MDDCKDLTDKMIKLFEDNGIKVGFITFINNNDSIVLPHGDFYESVKLVCEVTDKLKKKIVNDLKM